MDVIPALAEFTASSSTHELDRLARTKIKQHLLDTLGAGLAAVSEPGSRIILDVMVPDFTRGTARILGSTASTSAWDAAWVNAALCNMLDFDDTGFTHPGVCVVPAAMAIGETRGISGQELMLAIGVGYEICARMSYIIGGKTNACMREQGIHPMSVCGAVAAAATVCRALGLTSEQTLTAFGLAASASFGVTEQFGTWAKGINAANAARAGVTAALLAEKDFFGPRNGVDGRFGLLNALFGSDGYDLDAGLVGLGDVWAIADPGADLKLHPLCGATRGLVQAALELHDRVEVSQIDRIVVSVPERLLDTLRFDRPIRGYEGKFSVRYPIAVALLDGEVGIDSFSDESLVRPALQALMDRVELDVRQGGYDQYDRHDTPIRAYLLDGGLLDQPVETSPKGKRANPLSKDEIVEKFEACATRVMPVEEARRIVALVEGLESIRTTDLADALGTDGRTH